MTNNNKLKILAKFDRILVKMKTNHIYHILFYEPRNFQVVSCKINTLDVCRWINDIVNDRDLINLTMRMKILNKLWKELIQNDKSTL